MTNKDSQMVFLMLPCIVAVDCGLSGNTLPSFLKQKNVRIIWCTHMHKRILSEHIANRHEAKSNVCTEQRYVNFSPRGIFLQVYNPLKTEVSLESLQILGCFQHHNIFIRQAVTAKHITNGVVWGVKCITVRNGPSQPWDASRSKGGKRIYNAER